MLNIPGWSQDNIIVISALINGYDALDTTQKQAFHDLVGPDACPHIQTLHLSNSGLIANADLRHCGNEILTIIAKGPSTPPLPFPFFHLFCQSKLIKGVKALHAAALLTVDTLDTMTRRPVNDQLGHVLFIFHNFRLLSPENCLIILSESLPIENALKPSACIAKSLNILQKRNLVCTANIRTLMQCDPQKSLVIIHNLDYLGWFTPLFKQANFETMLKPDMLNNLFVLFSNIRENSARNKIWTNIETILRSKKREHFFPLLKIMSEKGILNQPMIDLLLNCSSIEVVSIALIKAPIDLLTEANCKRVLQWVAEIRAAMYKTTNLDPYFNKSLQFIERLQQAGLLTGAFAQTNFDAFFNYLSSQIEHARTEWHECKIMDQLIAINLFNGSNHQQKFEMLMKMSPSTEQTNDAILLLETIGLLETELALFHTLLRPLLFAQALEILVKSNCFDATFQQKFYKNMFKAGSPRSYAEAYCILSKEPLYFNDAKRKQVTLDDLKGCSDPWAVVQILQYLTTHKILTTDHLKLIKEKKSDTQLWAAINDLQQSPFSLTDIDLNILLQADRPSPQVIAQIIIKLKIAGVPIDDVNQNYLDRILNHIDPLDVCDATLCLKQLTLDEEEYQSYQDAVFNGGTGLIRLSSDPQLMSLTELSALIRCKAAYALFKNTLYSIRDDSNITVRELSALPSNPLKSCVKLFPMKKNTVCALSNEDLSVIRTATNQSEADNSCVSLAQAIVLLHNANILTAPFKLQYLHQVLTHISPVALAQAIIQLISKDYVTEALFGVMMAHPEPLGLINAITHLVINGIEPLLEDDLYINALIASSGPLQLAEGIVALKQKNILTDHFMQHHFTHLANHPTPLLYANALLILHHANLLDEVLNDPQFNLKFTTANKNAETYANIIVFFKRHDLLKSKLTKKSGYLTSYFSSIVNKIDAEILLHILKSFEAINIKRFKIDGPLVQATLSCLYPVHICNMLSQITKFATHLNSTNYCKTILITLLKHNDPKKAIVACHYLHENNLLAIDTVDATMLLVLWHSDAICTLQKHSKLTQSYLNQLTYSSHYAEALSEFDALYKSNHHLVSYLPIIMTHPYPCDFIKSIRCLQMAGLMTEANLTQIKHQGNVSSWLQQMHNSGLLNQRSFNRLMDYLYILGRIQNILHRIPENQFTHRVFGHIITICQANAANPAVAVTILIDYIEHTVLALPRAALPRLEAIELNTRQSTHTTSVHQSVSVSATKLWKRYHEKIENKIHEAIKKIDDYITHLPETSENLIAQRCWIRLKTRGFLNFKDPVSNVTTAQLIVLFWTAVHDLETRIYNKIDPEATVLAEGRALFVQALYEMQRDGNINAKDVDDGDKKDKLPSCSSGTFNKLVEKLNTIHPDVELIVITREGANDRFQIFVRKLCFEKMIQRINHAKDNGKTLDFATIDNAIELLWPEIQTVVSDLLFTEFCSIYNNDKKNADFIALLQLGPEVTFTAEQIQALKESNTVVAAGKKHPRDEDEEQQDSPRVDLGFFAQKRKDQDGNQPAASLEPEGLGFE